MVLLRKEGLNNNLGKILKQQRLLLSLTLSKLALESGISASYLARVEQGKRFPSAPVLQKIAKPLGFDEGELFTRAGYLSPQASTTESETGTGIGIRALDPYVGWVLAKEPIDIQLAVVGILSILRSLAKSVKKE